MSNTFKGSGDQLKDRGLNVNVLIVYQDEVNSNSWKNQLWKSLKMILMKFDFLKNNFCVGKTVGGKPAEVSLEYTIWFTLMILY